MNTQTTHLVSLDSSNNAIATVGGGASISGDGHRVVFGVQINNPVTGVNELQLVMATTGF